MLQRDAAVWRSLATRYVARFARKHVPVLPSVVDTGFARYVNRRVNDADGGIVTRFWFISGRTPTGIKIFDTAYERIANTRKIDRWGNDVKTIF